MIAGACISLPSSAIASETITYTYDARGRVVSVEHSGTVNDNIETVYTYDRVDNRVNVTVTGAPTGNEDEPGEAIPTYRRRYVFNGLFVVSIIKN